MYRLSILVFISLSLAVPALCDVPPVINYQGKLMQPSGAPVPDGAYSMTFAIYDVPTGGTPLWSETNPGVQVKGGLFAVLLGSINNLPANIFDNPNRWFGVKVGDDPEMTPRQQIASSAYAQSAGVAGNGVPVGGIIMWSGPADQIPKGWALCDGTNGTPDLRDRFVVGAGGGYAVGATGGAAQVTLTTAQMPSHNHGVNDPGHSHQIAIQCWEGGGANNGTPHYTGSWIQPTPIVASTTGITIQNTGGNQPHENRPPYYALCFIMKVGGGL